MSFFSTFTPFVEAPTIRTVPQPVSGGIIIDTRTAQGVSVRNPIKRQTSLLPQANSGRTDFVVECLNFDQSPAIDKTTPFSDRENITAVRYLQDKTQFATPIQVGDFLPNDGALEPLTIRDVASFKTTESPVAHRVRGTLMCGNEDKFGNAEIKGSFIEFEKNSDFVPYNDVVTGSLVVVGFTKDANDDKTRPFDDSEPDTRFLTNNGSINAQLLAMTGSIDDDFRPLNTKAATSGFVYSNLEGTDSLAFGDLLRQ